MLTLVLVLLLPLSARGAAQSEYDVKLAFLYNFMKFVEWPPSSFHDSSSPVALCILGPDPFNPSLEEELERKTVGQRPIVVRHIDSTQEAQSCQLLFVSGSESARHGDLLRPLRARPVLTVGEASDFIDQGGMIELSLDQERVRFEINARAAEAAGLKVSAKLMSVAKNAQSQAP